MHPAGCRNSSPPPATPQGCQSQRSGLYFCSPFPPSHSLRTRVAGGGLGGLRIRPGISAGSWGPKWAGETWPRSLLILCPPNGSPISPFRRGIPSLPPAAPQGHQPCPTSTSPPPSLPPCPTSYLVTGGSSHPIRCLWFSHCCLVGALAVLPSETLESHVSYSGLGPHVYFFPNLFLSLFLVLFIFSLICL